MPWRALAVPPVALAALVVLASLLAPRRASPAEALSSYEKESIRLALEEVNGSIDPAPDHKVIEGIDVVTLDVFEKRDPVPGFANWFHATTRDDVIRGEMLFDVGQRYDRAVAEETERNLRLRDQLSVVLIVPTKGSAPDRVRVLVITKDVWSLRVNWNIVSVNGRVQELDLQPSEENLFGRHKIVSGNVEIDRATYAVGVGFFDPRVAGTRLQAAADASVRYNCRTGDVEGSSGDFSYGKPLYSTRTKWAWSTTAVWTEGIERPYGVVGQSLCSDDRPVAVPFLHQPRGSRGQRAPSPVLVLVPDQYRYDVIQGQLAVVRSFGSAVKNDISFGLESNRRVFESPDLAAYPSDVQGEFRATLPVSDTRISPFVQLHGHRNRFLRVLDFETLGLQEDFPLGHDIWLRAFPAARALGSTRNLVGIHGGLGYTVPIWDGLVQAYGSTTIEVSNEAQSDAQATTGGRIVTPRLPFGRIVLDGLVLDRFKNYLNPSQVLGGTTRLRGYRTDAFVGPDLVVFNAEIRSRPVQILSVQVGAAAFYDVGDAFRNFSEMKLRQGVGGGLRLAFPQIQRSVFRLDVGVPLERGYDREKETSVVAQFEQAFPVPVLGP